MCPWGFAGGVGGAGGGEAGAGVGLLWLWCLAAGEILIPAAEACLFGSSFWGSLSPAEGLSLFSSGSCGVECSVISMEASPTWFC